MIQTGADRSGVLSIWRYNSFNNLRKGAVLDEIAIPIDNSDLDVTSKYLQDIRKQKRISHKQEIELAKEIEQLETELWKALLSYPLAVDIVKQYHVDWSQSIDQISIKLREIDRNRILINDVYKQVLKLSKTNPGQIENDGIQSNTVADSYLFRIEKNRIALQQTKNRFIQANLRLVVSTAKRFKCKTLPLIDLIQEGNIGLMKAVDRYDYRKEKVFSTYASWWIRHFVRRAIDNKSRVVRLPVHVIERNQKIIRTKQKFYSRYGRNPTNEEIKAEIGIACEVDDNWIDNCCSLDKYTDKDNGSNSLADFLKYEGPNQYDYMAGQSDSIEVQRLLNGLSQRERSILLMKYGFNGDEMTFQEIGNEFYLSRQAIEQTEKKILEKIRRGVARGYSGSPGG